MCQIFLSRAEEKFLPLRETPLPPIIGNDSEKRTLTLVLRSSDQKDEGGESELLVFKRIVAKVLKNLRLPEAINWQFSLID